MNAIRRNAAVNKFQSLVTENSRENLKVIILEDEKAYTDQEAEEILGQLYPVDSQKGAKKVKAESVDTGTSKKIAANIIDNELRPAGKTDVALTGGTGADTEWLRNKETGNTQRMNGEAARKLVKRKPTKFEIIVK